MKGFPDGSCSRWFGNSSRWKRALSFFLLLTCTLSLPACGEGQRPSDKDGVLIYAALNPVSSSVQSSIDAFNKRHTDVQIEIQDYSNDGGLDRLRTELVLGQVPDIMEMHYLGKSDERTEYDPTKKSWKNPYNDVLIRPEDEYWMPYQQMAQNGYLEDLWPYIENDPDIGRDGVLQAPMKAAEVNGSLYILFMDFRINTLMGRERVVGNRYSWTLEDLLESFSTMPEESTILRYNTTKKEIFDNLLCFSLERFVDRESCTCSFDSEEFREILAFLSCFPDEADIAQPQQTEEEIIRRIKSGKQMLEVFQISMLEKTIYGDALWGERAAFVGYPTADGHY